MIAAILGWVYLVSAAVVALYSGSFFILVVIYFLYRHRPPATPAMPPDAEWPPVTIQLPIYNEKHVVERLIDAVAAFDYPRDKLHIQVLDDSDDATTPLLRRKIARWQAQGLQIDLLRRSSREGYKAGALAWGLKHTRSEFVGVFDADFIPPQDFLRRVMPHFSSDPNVAVVQTRVAHLNADYSLLTRAQTLAIDQHFAVEQVSRSRGHLPMSMNGTGGVWRRSVIEDAGGWSPATLTEDLDLSYRAFLRGWRFQYLVDVAVPGELPSQLTAYKTQQARWAQGSTQCLVKHGPSLVRSGLSPLQKAMGILHLGQYAIQPFLLLLFLLTPPLVLTDRLAQLPLEPLGLSGLAPLLIIALGQIVLYPDWLSRLRFFPALTLLGTSMTLNNSRAVLAGLFDLGSNEFRRTPKFRVIHRGENPGDASYVQPPDWTAVAELGLGLYAVTGLTIALVRMPGLALYMFVYVLAFGGIPILGLWQWWKTTAVHTSQFSSIGQKTRKLRKTPPPPS